MPRRLASSRWLRYIVTGLVLGFWLVFLRGQLVALRQHSWQVTPVTFGLAVVWGALYFGNLACCWAWLVRQMSGANVQVSVVAAGRIWLCSMMTRYIPGNVWHIVGRVALANQLHVPTTQVLSSASIEQVLTLLGAGALVVVTLPFWSIIPNVQWSMIPLVFVGLVVVHPRVFGAALTWIAMKLDRPYLAWNYHYRQILGLVLAYGGAHFCAGIALYIILWGMVPVTVTQLPLIVGAAAAAWVVGYLSILTPSGLGVREAVLVTVLASLYPLPIATAASLLFRLVLTIGELGAMLLAWRHRQI